MTDKTEEKIAQERAAVDAMRNAKSNMDQAFARISTLESALKSASMSISGLKGYIAAGAYCYPCDKPRKCHDLVDDAVTAIAKVMA